MRKNALARLSLFLLAGCAVAAAAIAQAPPVIRDPMPAPARPNVLPLPPAVIDNGLTVAGEDLKVRKVDTRLLVDVLLNDRGPYRFLVDSGADTSVVGLRVAGALKLPIGTPVVLNGMTARNTVDRVKVDRLRLGSTDFTGLQLPALREEHLGSDGIIGIDALVQQRLMMDFEKRTISVEDSRKPYKALPGEIVVTARRKRGQLILTEVKAAGLQLDAVIDTGSEVTIGNIALRNRIAKRARDKLMTVTAIGVTGVPVQLEMVVLSDLKVGSVRLTNVPVAFADLPPFDIFGLSKEPALLLGTDLLDTFRRVSLDFGGRKVRFQLRRCGSNPVTISTMASSVTRVTSTDEQVCRR
jgi:hypothetical protein